MNASICNLASILQQEPSLLGSDELQRAQLLSMRNNLSLFETIVSEKLLDEDLLLNEIAARTGLERINVDLFEPDRSVTQLIPADFASKRLCMPLRIQDNQIHVAVYDPTNVDTLDELKLLFRIENKNFQVVLFLSSRDEIRQAIKRIYGLGAEAAERLIAQEPVTPTRNDNETDDLVIATTDTEPSIIQFVNMILIEAVQSRATDIHIEPFERKLRIRQRIDGMLHEIPIPHAISKFADNVVSRIKVMAHLDISERRLPHDGRIKIKIDTCEYDLRVSVLPTPYGEAVNIRILSQNMRLLDLEQLGLEADDLPCVQDLINRPNGIILVTGPTGSGKTTFLYSCLSKINALDRKIITIEDPIEYRIEGVLQMQTAQKIDFTFQRALRSMLRHDPDIMMIGEIRDTETAQITVRSALTGHLVLSTLHTNDAAGAIARLVDMQIEPFLVASSLLSVLAIRLVRVLCPHCKRAVILESAVVERLNADAILLPGMQVFEPVGCSHCRYTGFSGRMGIFEILKINEDIRNLIQQRVATSSIKAAAVANGMKTLRQDGWRKVKLGLVNIDEVLRVSHADELTTSRGN